MTVMTAEAISLVPIPSAPVAPQRRGRRRVRLLVACVSALSVVAAYLGVTALTATAADTLLSQGQPVTASSVPDATAYPATAAVDGNTGTRWSSASSDPQWLQVDLGGTATISQVQLDWEAAYATAFQIQVFANASTWTSIYSTTTGAGGNKDYGNAIASVLFGDVNPSGKLPVSFPKALTDVPARTAQQWSGANNQIQYSEGMNVGYRWYDSQNIAPLFPIGYGLSYPNPRGMTSPVGKQASLQITDTGSGLTYRASGLPAGLSIVS
jgi:F5/8 type C domain-containing protein/glycosyl hydrolase family 3